jgi:uncharacterized cupin superfamily protein
LAANVIGEGTMSKARIAQLADIPVNRNIIYPPHLREPFAGRAKRRLGDAVGMKNFGVNLATLEPGAWSSHRHWHTRQDEMIYLIEGELTLVTDSGREVLKPGAVVGFPANAGEAHNLINTGTKTAVYLEVGDRLPGDDVYYADVDLEAKQNPPSYRFTKKDGSAY